MYLTSRIFVINLKGFIKVILFERITLIKFCNYSISFWAKNKLIIFYRTPKSYLENDFTVNSFNPKYFKPEIYTLAYC